MSIDTPRASGASHAAEIDAGQRFPFGANWARFLRRLDHPRIEAARASLATWLGKETLAGQRLLDAGSGSGLFSLAARQLGAQVHSFDFDPQSVACTQELRRRHETGELPGAAATCVAADGDSWLVQEGSVLDPAYLADLGLFDVVYSWGVLHHTGRQWEALHNVSERVSPGGLLFIALYNDQGGLSRWWTTVKRLYNRHALWRVLFIAVYTPYFVWARWLYTQFSGRGGTLRGMSLWFDLLDWLGGYPFEVSRPEQVFDFLQQRGFELRKLATEGGKHGCNQFLFQRVRLPDQAQATPSTRA